MTFPEEVDEYSSIQRGLEALNEAAQRWQQTMHSNQGDTLKGSCARQSVRDELVLEALKFLQIAQGPIDAAATCYERTAHLASVRALLEMGVFEALPAGRESRSTEQLARELNVDESLLARLLRNSSLYGPFEETGPGQYRHTPFSVAYLRPEIRGMFRFAMDDHMPAHLKLHEFLQRNGWQEPSSTTDNPYTYAHKTNGKSMFDNLSEKPERMKAFNNGMTLQAITPLWMIDLFPWKGLTQSKPSASQVVAVDIGGGKGTGISRIRTLCDDLPGRYILQDQAHVVKSVEGSLDPMIERMSYDFFTEQPIRGALTYLIRRCLHNWPQDKVVCILKNIAAAMEPEKSRLLIEEIVVPAEKSGVEEGWMDMIMMSLGAKQRTLKEWGMVLGLAGLEVKNVYQVPGNCHGLIEAWLK
ncbi:S-adenosyl-L-methionine-dependent methyltransferase [Aspergillus costaricaensis CBS 115574]|uniref:S-adenosyl-L-methionine-dependent methyltransferase n=1 Tax=Aspergillus costaricaensis CBS 115574 TaxID=1448317 RepID=A0ACD1IES5_9EURO|nr:S-adenosyl-L-methionine-dependent methyltransferase [Aspergillus costaricaensis CBS 115574]RAK88251.1 S-adenosyl-L-methionine-dependent methyltransferase [Aspergillus costaricaensis CBS 115574]